MHFSAAIPGESRAIPKHLHNVYNSLPQEKYSSQKATNVPPLEQQFVKIKPQVTKGSISKDFHFVNF